MEPDQPSSVSVVLGRGSQSRLRLAGLLSMLFLVILMAFVPLAPSDASGRPWVVGLFGVLSLLALAAFLPYAWPLTLLVDASGISLSSRGRVRRSMSWAEIKGVQYGTLRLSLARIRPQLDGYLLVIGESGRVALRVTGPFFKTAPGAVLAAAHVAAEIAKSRSIPVRTGDQRF